MKRLSKSLKNSIYVYGTILNMFTPGKSRARMHKRKKLLQIDDGNGGWNYSSVPYYVSTFKPSKLR